MRLELIVRAGKHAGKVLQFSTESILIGRDQDCQLRSASSDVSRHHCRLIKHTDQVTIEDLGSQNGTFVNGQKLTEKKTLRSGDLIRIAKMEFQIRLRAENTPESPSTDSASIEENISDWLRDVPGDVSLQDTTVMMEARNDSTAPVVRPASPPSEPDPIVLKAAEIIRQYWRSRKP